MLSVQSFKGTASEVCCLFNPSMEQSQVCCLISPLKEQCLKCAVGSVL